ncbi:MAG: carbohydrate porin [Planctomycetales bacterium]|nr:carbohydrate porin [Planctomycetales bacterium]
MLHKSTGSRILVLLACSVSILLDTVAHAQDSTETGAAQPPASMPLPQHAMRSGLIESNSRPVAAQSGRPDYAPSSGFGSRETTPFPIPGQPARNLLPPGEIEPAEDPGLFRRLPHGFRDGGITLEYIYTGETFTKATGGLNNRHVTNYRSNLDIVAIVDTLRMGWWNGGRIFIYGENLSGKPISTSDVGDTQLFSNLDSTISDTERPNFTTIAEYWYEHSLLDNLLRFKIGKQDANADFAFTDLGGEFVNSSFGLVPTVPLPTFPSQALGVASMMQLTDTWGLSAGIYDGTPADGPQGVRWGFDTLGHNGAISLLQFDWQPQFGALKNLPHTSRLGFWHHSDKYQWSEIAVGPGRDFVQNYGMWYIADQMVYQENDQDDQGLGVFFQFSWAPANRNEITEYYGGGLVYKGLLPNREEDYLGVGFANILFSPAARTVAAANSESLGTNETAIEVFYRYQCSAYFVLQPDVQFIASPSGSFKDALLPGVRFEILL